MTNPYVQIARELAGTPFGQLEYVEETGSTNADSAPLLGDERFAGRTLVAEYQHHGAGRKGRAWLAPSGTSLLFTTIVPDTVATASLWIVPFWTALAVQHALSRHGVDARVHWPNDLLLGDRKLAGILCQSRVAGDTAWVACGVGINVHRYAGADANVEPPPAFCDDVTPVDRAALLGSVLSEYDASRQLLAEPSAVAAQWQRAAGLPGATYRILKDGEERPFEATALRLAGDGALVVRREDGREDSIALADARALR